MDVAGVGAKGREQIDPGAGAATSPFQLTRKTSSLMASLIREKATVRFKNIQCY